MATIDSCLKNILYNYYDQYNCMLYLYEIYIKMLVAKIETNCKCPNAKLFDEILEKYDIMEKLLIHCSNLCLTDNAIHQYDNINQILNTFILEEQLQNYYICGCSNVLYNVVKIDTIKQIKLKYNIILTLTNNDFVETILDRTYDQYERTYYLFDDCDLLKKNISESYDRLLNIIHNDKYNKIFDIVNVVAKFYLEEYSLSCVFLPIHHSIINIIYNKLIYAVGEQFCGDAERLHSHWYNHGRYLPIIVQDLSHYDMDYNAIDCAIMDIFRTENFYHESVVIKHGFSGCSSYKHNQLTGTYHIKYYVSIFENVCIE